MALPPQYRFLCVRLAVVARAEAELIWSHSGFAISAGNPDSTGKRLIKYPPNGLV
jgi:hypothetical protein